MLPGEPHAIFCRPGDRVATLAWNTVRHLECWYGVAGAGAVCHTLNPRLFDKELTYIANHAGDSVILADACFAELLERLAPGLPSVRHVVYLTDDRCAPGIHIHLVFIFVSFFTYVLEIDSVAGGGACSACRRLLPE